MRGSRLLKATGASGGGHIPHASSPPLSPRVAEGVPRLSQPWPKGLLSTPPLPEERSLPQVGQSGRKHTLPFPLAHLAQLPALPSRTPSQIKMTRSCQFPAATGSFLAVR